METFARFFLIVLRAWKLEFDADCNRSTELCTDKGQFMRFFCFLLQTVCSCKQMCGCDWIHTASRRGQEVHLLFVLRLEWLRDLIEGLWKVACLLEWCTVVPGRTYPPSGDFHTLLYTWEWFTWWNKTSRPYYFCGKKNHLINERSGENGQTR